jgi:hypothetical protein
MSDDSQRGRFGIIEKLPQWFVPAAGIIYATGFLIITTYFDRFGLRESSSDFFKVKYIHAGILYWLIPTLVAMPFYGFYLVSSFRKEADPQSSVFKVYLPTVLLVVNLLAVFYIVAVFAPVGFTRDKEYAVPAMFIVTVLGIIGINLFTKHYVKDEQSDRFGNVARWVLCLVVLFGLDVYTLNGLFQLLWDISWKGGVYFFVFMLLALVTVERTRIRTSAVTDWRQRVALKMVAGCILVAIYYLSVLAFALRLYPYIPVTKGGGNYVDAPTAVLCFQETNAKFALPDLVGPTSNDCIPSKPLQIIEETTTSVFVADPAAAGGPPAWLMGKKACSL